MAGLTRALSVPLKATEERMISRTEQEGKKQKLRRKRGKGEDRMGQKCGQGKGTMGSGN